MLVRINVSVGCRRTIRNRMGNRCFQPRTHGWTYGSVLSYTLIPVAVVFREEAKPI
jgi:hypothetical protein